MSLNQQRVRAGIPDHAGPHCATRDVLNLSHLSHTLDGLLMSAPGP